MGNMDIKNIRELRRMYGNIRHKPEDIIIIGLYTVICGGEDFTDKRKKVATYRNIYIRFLLS